MATPKELYLQLKTLKAELAILKVQLRNRFELVQAKEAEVAAKQAELDAELDNQP